MHVCAGMRARWLTAHILWRQKILCIDHTENMEEEDQDADGYWWHMWHRNKNVVKTIHRSSGKTGTDTWRVRMNEDRSPKTVWLNQHMKKIQGQDKDQDGNWLDVWQKREDGDKRFGCGINHIKWKYPKGRKTIPMSQKEQQGMTMSCSFWLTDISC